MKIVSFLFLLIFSISGVAQTSTNFDEFDRSTMLQVNNLFSTQLPIATGVTTSRQHGVKTKKVYVFIHGLSESSHYYSNEAERAFQTGYNVIIGELPGHTFRNLLISQLNAGLWLAYVDYLALVAKSYGDEVIFVGHSLGGQLVIRAAEDAHVNKIILFQPLISSGNLGEVLTKLSPNIPVKNYYRYMVTGGRQALALAAKPYRVLPHQIEVDIYLSELDIVVNNQVTRNWATEFAPQSRIHVLPSENLIWNHFIHSQIQY